MKKILFGIIAISLVLITYFQYTNWKRFNPPVDYSYAISDEIDVNYYNSSEVMEYFEKANEIGAFARQNWSSNEIDVRFPNEASIDEVNAAKYYNQLISRVSFLEQKLKNSITLKSEGFSNADIEIIESGYPKMLLKSGIDRNSMSALQIGDQSRFVWYLQQKLIEKGYPHQLDGLFGTDTQNALTTYQNDQGLYPSGAMNTEVFDKLFLNK